MRVFINYNISYFRCNDLSRDVVKLSLKNSFRYKGLKVNWVFNFLRENIGNCDELLGTDRNNPL
mgnify:CR=1 FL=1